MNDVSYEKNKIIYIFQAKEITINKCEFIDNATSFGNGGCLSIYVSMTN